MSYIKSIVVQNFQSHRKTVLNLSKGVNAIVGNSDCGKSALFRALVWDILNKPKGDKNFRSRWGGDTSIEIEFSDGTSVERKKTKDNLYILNGDEENAFTAFKEEIPGPIYEALNMEDINLQTQMDAPFLLSSSSGDVAKLLNKIANLTTIDTTLSNIRKRTLGVSRDITSIKEQMDELEAVEKSFSYLKQMEKDVEALNVLLDRWGAMDDETTLLSALIDKISEDENELDDFEILVSFEKRVKEALAMQEQKKSLFQDTLALEYIIKKIEKLSKELNALLDLDDAEEALESVLKLSAERNEARTHMLQLNSLVGSTRAKLSKLEIVEEEIEALEQQFHDEFPDKCPLCGE